MKRAAVLLVLAIPLALLLACKTKPKPPEVPVEKPVEIPVEKPVEKPKDVAPAKPAEKPFVAPASRPLDAAAPLPTAPEAPDRPLQAPVAASSPAATPLTKPRETPKAVADSDVQKARDALARAKAADAAYYEPDLFRVASGDLDVGLKVRYDDPDRSRALLASATEKADRAYGGSVKKGAAELDARWASMDATLRGVAADKFFASRYGEILTQWGKATTLYRAGGDVAAAKALAYAALKAQTDLYDRLNQRFATIEVLRKEVGKQLDEAEQVEADKWAPKELAETMRLYLLGVESFQSYRLDETEEYYGAAREAGKHAVAVARQNRSRTEEARRAEAARLMQAVMKDLEAASKMTVVTDDGTVILPKEWSGEDILKGIEKLDTVPAASGKQSIVLPVDGATVVAGDTYEENLLEQAKELWRKGLVENGKGDYQKAIEYFKESKKYVDAYKAQAVKAVYTVRLIPERRDCLWRIAAYDFIYGDPFLWPKIWRRNRKLIQNPDLVYPGWLLVVPPED